MAKSLQQRLEILDSILKELCDVAVAFSGGVDSTFLLWRAHKVLGSGHVWAVTGKSKSFPEWEMKGAITLAKEKDIPHLFVETHELEDGAFCANPKDRCYLCKKELFRQILAVLPNKKISVIEGSNKDDDRDYRPGKKAILEYGIRSPLKEAMFTKKEIRSVAEKMRIPVWNKPSTPCLASRFPYGTVINEKKLLQVEKAENFLSGCGFQGFRVRHHEEVARIEIQTPDFQRFDDASLRKKIYLAFQSFGYKYITLDLLGYRQGSMNEGL
jgi:pyridinium-3,5-biscarboxylic acid mononucleotide sulfurtransferase